MGFLMDIWNGLRNGLEGVLRFYEGLLEPIVGLAAWGIAIILLTVTVRIFMIPLMVRQVKSMRAMQTVQPEMKKIQEKYKADRSMMKTDPDRYKKLKEKQREEQMALYQEHGVNPVGGCLPLLLQMPVFLALFQVLQGPSLAPDLSSAPFLGLASLSDTAANVVSGGASGFSVPAALTVLGLIVLQVGTTFYSQKQMMARSTTAGAEQQQAQKMMLYVMPPFLGFLSYTFPIGVVLYWVTTNVWTIGQQFFIFRQVEAQEAAAAAEREEAKKNKGRTGPARDEDEGGTTKPRKKDSSSSDEPEAKPTPKKPSAKGPRSSGPGDQRSPGGKRPNRGKGGAGSRPSSANGTNGSGPKGTEDGSNGATQRDATRNGSGTTPGGDAAGKSGSPTSGTTRRTRRSPGGTPPR